MHSNNQVSFSQEHVSENEAGTTVRRTFHLVSYSDFVRRCAKLLENETQDMMHATVGISGEAGELLDAAKKVWIYNKPLDRENVVEELGDLNFYIQHLQNVLGITDEEIINHNVAKLSKRYKDGYSDKAAQERADKQPGE